MKNSMKDKFLQLKRINDPLLIVRFALLSDIRKISSLNFF